ncbi:MAG: hypothetical protein U9Q19_06330, partial [Pseudomonadota bacterium]|nr:hypothetical protein [Pseudomonadota bacterium]
LGLLTKKHTDAETIQLADTDIISFREQRTRERRSFGLASLLPGKDSDAGCIREDRRGTFDRRRNNFTNSYFPEAALQMQNG